MLDDSLATVASNAMQIKHIYLLTRMYSFEQRNLKSHIFFIIYLQRNTPDTTPFSTQKYKILYHPTRGIFRDYLMAFWLSPEVSTRDPIISPRALARGLIMVEG